MLPRGAAAAMLLLTLRGTPTIYYGDEIGMTQVPIPPDRVRDPFEKNVPGIGVGRDGARTSMQWDAGDFAGFSMLEPWLPISDNFRTENVETELREPSSICNLYRRLVSARRQRPALSTGRYRRILAERPIILHKAGGQRAKPNRAESGLGSDLDGAPVRLCVRQDPRVLLW
jgi:alpha-glucosidase